ncbi:MAG: response regulator transcription factor [Magnetococcales bacterium]|nr:response regulator transcription factor [Magnetococcales bacterium]
MQSDNTVKQGGVAPSILLVDDDPVWSRDIVQFLTIRGFPVRRALTTQAMFQVLGEKPADLIILDVLLGNENGLQSVPAIRARFPEVGILIVSCLDNPEDQAKGLATEVDGYLPKNVDLMVMEATLRNIAQRLDRMQRFVPSVLRIGDASSEWLLDPASWELTTPQGATVRLTHSENIFLRTLMESPGLPVSRAIILKQLGKGNRETDDQNLEALVRRLRRKIERDVGISLPVSSVYGKGYAFIAVHS